MMRMRRIRQNEPLRRMLSDAMPGPEKVMKSLAPQGKVYQAGTLSGNPVASVAGLAKQHGIADHTIADIDHFLTTTNKVFSQLAKNGPATP